MKMNQNNDFLIEAAAGEFWAVIADAFPEVTSGDTQLSGEDEAAIAVWIYGDAGERHLQARRVDLPIPDGMSLTRVVAATARGIEAAGKVFADAGVVSVTRQPPAGVVWQLESCVRHILHFNLPNQGEETFAEGVPDGVSGAEQ